MKKQTKSKKQSNTSTNKFKCKGIMLYQTKELELLGDLSCPQTPTGASPMNPASFP